MELTRTARETLTAVEMNCGDELAFTLDDGSTRRIELLETDADIIFSTIDEDEFPIDERDAPQGGGARTFYEFTCTLDIDGTEHTLRREVPTQKSFYEPWVIDGVQIWFDAVDDIFNILTDSHGPGDRLGRPAMDARFAFQDNSKRICPTPVHAWCPLPRNGMDISRCYRGEDCWLGPYHGVAAHVGLDINHPDPTPIWAPIDFDDQYYVDSVDDGDSNNRHRGIHHWDDGSRWELQCHHMTHLVVDEHDPVQAGDQYASGAGVKNGYHEHSHFFFRVVEPDGTEILLDPWILFRQMYRDIEAGLVREKWHHLYP